MKISPEKLKEYDPLEADPPSFSRELFTGALNRFFLNGHKLVEPKNSAEFPYDSNSWMSSEQLFYHLLSLVEMERAKGIDRDSEIILNYLTLAQALDIEPNPHNCGGICDCKLEGYDGPNPSLVLLRTPGRLYRKNWLTEFFEK